MMSSVTAGAIPAGVDAVDGSSLAAAPPTGGASAFALTFDALFAEVAVPADAAAPGGEPVEQSEAGLAAELALIDGLDSSAADALALLGIPFASQPSLAAPPAALVQWLRSTPERIAGAASPAIAPLVESMATTGDGIDGASAGGGGSLQPTPPATSGSLATPDALAAVVQRLAAEPRATERDDAALVPVDGPQSALAADPAPVQRHAPEPLQRALPPPITVPLQSPNWNLEFAARVSWMVERGEQLASIRLTPEQLGPVEVRLAIREGEASIWFGAANADTRAAIEQALPRLREMLAASGLALADSGVFQGSPRDPRHGLVRADSRRAAGESVESVSELRLHHRRLGLIDDYA